MIKVAFVISHPIQYFSPLFSEINKDKDVELKIFYCSDYGLGEKRYSPEVGEMEKFDIPLLEGYSYEFVKNNSPIPSIHNGFFGLLNFSLIKKVRSGKFDIVIIHGWRYLSFVMLILLKFLLRSKIGMRSDNNLLKEHEINPFKRIVKNLYLKYILFPKIDYFLYVGELNKKFYKKYGAKDADLIFIPFAVDNSRFQKEHEEILANTDYREKYNIDKNSFVILYVAKMIKKKRPEDLLKAFLKLNDHQSYLIFVGTGPLMETIKKTKDEKKLDNILVQGFVNQSQLKEYYSIADVFILPSYEEPWGLVVNEAMNFKLPIIVSDQVGCAPDLIKENGFVYKAGDIDELTEKIRVLKNNKDITRNYGKASRLLIDKYSYNAFINSLKNLNIK